MSKYKRWTEEEDKYLIERSHHKSRKEIASDLNRTELSIKGRQQKFGLKPKKEKPVYELFEGYVLLETGTVPELAEKMGLGENTIRYYASEHHMKRVEKLEDAMVAFRIN